MIAAAMTAKAGAQTRSPMAEVVRSRALFAILTFQFIAGAALDILYALGIVSNPQVQFSARGNTHVIRLEVPSLFDYRDLAMRMVASACKLVEGSRKDAIGKKRRDGQFTAEVISAFGEAFNNVVLHSYGVQGGDLKIEIEVDADGLTIRVMDYGKTFDFAAVPTPNLDDLPESGLGLFIIQSCMDKVSYVPGSPNVLSMTKYIGNP